MNKIVQLTAYLHEQFPATVGNIQLRDLLCDIELEHSSLKSRLKSLQAALAEVENACHNALQKDGTVYVPEEKE